VRGFSQGLKFVLALQLQLTVSMAPQVSVNNAIPPAYPTHAVDYSPINPSLSAAGSTLTGTSTGTPLPLQPTTESYAAFIADLPPDDGAFSQTMYGGPLMTAAAATDPVAGYLHYDRLTRGAPDIGTVLATGLAGFDGGMYDAADAGHGGGVQSMAWMTTAGDYKGKGHPRQDVAEQTTTSLQQMMLMSPTMDDLDRLHGTWDGDTGDGYGGSWPGLFGDEGMDMLKVIGRETLLMRLNNDRLTIRHPADV
jgi:hypothetical protein